MVVHRVVSEVGYVQRPLRFRSDLMGIKNVEVPCRPVPLVDTWARPVLEGDRSAC